MTKEELKKKVGSIFKVAYNPQFSIGFKAFCKTYVKGATEISAVGDTIQYHVDNIWQMSEDLMYDISIEDEALFNYLAQEEKVEYIEF